MRSRLSRVIPLIIPALLASSPAWSQPQNFVTDVSTAIDRGLTWLDDAGYFAPGIAGDATGLVALTLLEKRPGGDPGAPPQGYAGASSADQARIDGLIGHLVSTANLPFFAYRNGQEMMALALYLRTGGPDQSGALAALNAAFDESATLVGLNDCTPNGSGGCEPGTGGPEPCIDDGFGGCRPGLPSATGVAAWDGYWCYMELNCPDSSTTQFVISGMSAARFVYADPAYADPDRLTALNLLAARSAAAYQANGESGEYCSPGGELTASEAGHGYNVGSCNSFQQTASGAWVQLIGGATVNTPGVQQYLEWMRNRYRYADNEANDWGNVSYGYGLWNASRMFSFLDASPVAPEPGNLSTADFGMLAPEAAPPYEFLMDEFGVVVTAGRQMRLNPADVPRPPAFGPEGAGHYAGTSGLAPWYFDFAATLIARQDPYGYFESSSGWSIESEQAYHILVLERSVGGGCTDSDGDGLCDNRDNCAQAANGDQADGDSDGRGDACDVCPGDPTNDVDSDGLCGGVDNCPYIANPDQLDGDGDALGDACDACPEDASNDADGDQVCGNIDNCADAANTGQTDLDGDGVGDACDECISDPLNDADNDDVCGAVDNCADAANADQADADGDGIGDACDVCANDAANDADGDGVCGDLDNCPLVANTDQADANSNGVGDACDNLPPVAVDDTATTPAGTAVEIAVLTNDTDPENDTLTIAAVTQPAHGTAAVGPVGKVTYTPAAGYSGADAFTYTINDGHGGAATGDVAVTVTQASNEPPVCSAATPSLLSIWPPNHQLVPVTVLGVTDPNGDPVTIAITAIFQDEPTNTYGDGNTPVDGKISGATAMIRAERQGNKDGRVYHIRFTATDGRGGSCTGEVEVCVPHDQGRYRSDDNDRGRTWKHRSRKSSAACTDGGAIYNSLVPGTKPKPDHDPRGCRDRDGHEHGRSDYEDWDRDKRSRR